MIFLLALHTEKILKWLKFVSTSDLINKICELCFTFLNSFCSNVSRYTGSSMHAWPLLACTKYLHCVIFTFSFCLWRLNNRQRDGSTNKNSSAMRSIRTVHVIPTKQMQSRKLASHVKTDIQKIATQILNDTQRHIQIEDHITHTTPYH